MSDKRVYFAGLFRRQKESNTSIEAFCRANNISSGSFHYWKQKFTSEYINSKSVKRIKPQESVNRGVELVLLTIDDNRGSTDDANNIVRASNRDIKEYSPEVLYPNGVSLKLGQPLSKDELISFITLLD